MQVSSSLTQILFYILALLGGYAASGVLMAACRVPLWAWLLNALLIVYLALAGKGAIAIANFWLALLLVLYTVNRPWPKSILHWLPLNTPQLWSLTLLALWGMALTVTFLLGFAADFMRHEGWTAWERLVSLSAMALFSMGMGHLFFQAWVLP